MSYIGNEPPDTGAYGVQSFDGGGTEFTLSKPSTTATVLLFIDGVRQTPVDAYSVSGVNLTTTGTTPAGTDNVTVQFLGDVVDFGEPSDDSVSTAKIQDDAVTAAKLANSINTEIAANTAKVTNATHTGDVTGATALTIANDAVDIAMLSATGTASATTFLRGDNAWAAPAGGTLVNVVQTQDYTGAINVDGVTSYATAGSDFLVSITPTSTSSTVLIMAGSAIGGIDGDTSYAGELKIYRQIASGGYASITASPVAHINGASGKRRPWTFMYLDSPSTTSQVDYQLYMRASDNAVVHFAVDGFSRFITALEIGA